MSKQYYIELGATPTEEDCEQVGDNYNLRKAREECLRYITQLEKMFPITQPSNRYSIKSFSHDFGNYLEVIIYFDEDDPKSIEYAYNVESNLPEHWEN